MTPKRPMLAAELKGELRFPVLASPKYDGIRMLKWGEQALTRSLLPLPNKHVCTYLTAIQSPWVLDGELLVGSETDPQVYRTTFSGVMSQEGEPDFVLRVFDHAGPGPYTERLEQVAEFIDRLNDPRLLLSPQTPIATPEELDDYESRELAMGYEGIMTRQALGLYKHGRCSMVDQALVKVKRFKDADAVILGTEELYRNVNEPIVNALGLQERSSHTAGMVPAGVLGALICRTFEGVVFKIGTGFTFKERTELWEARDALPGHVVKYRYLEKGMWKKPRHPSYLGLRSRLDM